MGADDGVTGRTGDTAPVPAAARLVRAVESVVDVDCALLGPRRRPNRQVPGGHWGARADRAR
ncbi:hypothetical protein ACIRVK_32815 [Streptomyces sp. NPDC101152]|uniref:hypothetical protein n=1 Tax=Streptomyces sp. NPDC101152 TaxID=3366116 RepID=UPI0037F5CDF3